jgi:3-hydroxybutyryl-CoA dehydratase
MIRQMADQWFFEDFSVGQRFEFGRRTVTDAHFALFAAISGDNHPIHYDDVYASQTRFGRRVAHGLLVAAMTAMGAGPLSVRLHDSMVAFLEQSTRFLRPVFVGDSVAVEAEVAELIPKKEAGVVKLTIRVSNQNGEIVLEGWQRYLIKRRED